MWLGISPLDRITNEEVHKRVDQKPIVVTMRQRQLRWLGHALRRNEKDPANIFALYEPSKTLGQTKRGRPVLNYVSYIIGLLFPNKNDVSINEVVNLANDRKLWKSYVAECSKWTFE